VDVENIPEVNACSMVLTVVSAPGLERRHYPLALTRMVVPEMVVELVMMVLEVSMVLVQLFVPLVLTHLLL
jgi:hypothetical protein